MALSIRVRDRVARGTMGPSLLLVVLEIPMLVTYFSRIDPTGVGPNLTPGGSANPGVILLMFLAFLSFVVGYFARQPGRAVKIFTLSQVITFSLAAVPLFVYPPTSLGLALVGCNPNCSGIYENQLILRIFFFYLLFAFVVLLFGLVSAGLGSFVGERFRGAGS